jgi:hypothetical protein
MLALLRLLVRAGEIILAAPARMARQAIGVVALPRLGPLRWVIHAALAYVLFAVMLVYVVAPVRGIVGSYVMADKTAL